MMGRFTSQPMVAGVELGGTKCVCTLGRGPGAVEDQVVIPTLDPHQTLTAIADQLLRWRKSHGFASLGIGSFGPIDLNPRSANFGCLGQTPKPGWQGAAVLQTIAGAFDVPMRLDTDVNAAALAEMHWGVGRDVDLIAYITVGTGIGVGFAGGTFPGASRAHAELGHVRVVRQADDLRESVCPYHSDCAEGLASGKAITVHMTQKEIEGLATSDVRFRAPISYLGQLCHTIACATGPDRIALGGGVLASFPQLVPEIEKSMRESLNGYLTLPDTPLLMPAELGSAAGPLGSIALALTAGSIPGLAIGPDAESTRKQRAQHV